MQILCFPLSLNPSLFRSCRPNDNAVTAFLQKMGLSVDDLKKRPLLAKQLAAQHLILHSNVRAEELFANGPSRIVTTAAHEPNDLVFKKLSDGSVKVTDVQGQTANVKKAFFIDDNKTGHPIDKVLMPGRMVHHASSPPTVLLYCCFALYCSSCVKVEQCE